MCEPKQQRAGNCISTTTKQKNVRGWWRLAVSGLIEAVVAVVALIEAVIRQ